MRVAVTGAEGFVGSHLMTALEADGYTAVSLGPVNEVDIRDRAEVRRRLADLAPDRIVHLAAVSGPMLFSEEPEFVMHVNSVGTVNVLEAAKQLDAPVVLASSVSVATEGSASAPRPASVYGVTKRLAELLGELYRNDFGLPCTAVRIGSVYGAGRQTEHVIDSMIDDAITHRTVSYSGTAHEPLVHVRDAASLLAALVGAQQSWQERYDLVTTPITHEDLAHVVCDVANNGAIPSPVDRTGYSWPITFDSTALYEDTGSAYAVDVQTGVAEVFDAHRDRS